MATSILSIQVDEINTAPIDMTPSDISFMPATPSPEWAKYEICEISNNETSTTNTTTTTIEAQQMETIDTDFPVLRLNSGDLNLDASDFMHFLSPTSTTTRTPQCLNNYLILDQGSPTKLVFNDILPSVFGDVDTILDLDLDGDVTMSQGDDGDSSSCSGSSTLSPSPVSPSSSDVAELPTTMMVKHKRRRHNATHTRVVDSGVDADSDDSSLEQSTTTGTHINNSSKVAMSVGDGILKRKNVARGKMGPRSGEALVSGITTRERDLLLRLGVTIPTALPLTKPEERTLRGALRKIRNKVFMWKHFSL